MGSATPPTWTEGSRARRCSLQGVKGGIGRAQPTQGTCGSSGLAGLQGSGQGSCGQFPGLGGLLGADGLPLPRPNPATSGLCSDRLTPDLQGRRREQSYRVQCA